MAFAWPIILPGTSNPALAAGFFLLRTAKYYRAMRAFLSEVDTVRVKKMQ
ncbi:MAG: hypothetical protein USCAAHI_02108 [Beijerinckiaceae bacterium]|jgi:hypothetical protein|nr:MAG: hypothetical protein USCAAHI_02108 [Beijerinckiaceae bacterium]